MFVNIKAVGTAFTGLVVLSGFGFKINKYESNLIYVGRDKWSQLYIKPESFDKLKMVVDGNFQYFYQGKKHVDKIIAIQKFNNYYRVQFKPNNKLEKRENSEINWTGKEISYILETKNYWENLIYS